MSVKKQALINTAGNAVYLITLWLLTVITTRGLGYESAGELTLAMAVGNIFATVQLFGVRSFQSSDMIFQYSPRDYLRARAITTASGIILCSITCLILGYSPYMFAVVMLFLLFKTSETFSDVFFGDDQRMGKLELAGYSMFLRGILTGGLFLAGTVLFKRLDLSLLITSAGAIILTLFFDLAIYRKTVRNFNEPSGGAFGILNNCFPLLLAALIPTAVISIPRIFLERHFGTEILGYYGNISTPALLLTTVIPTILTAFLPGYGKAFREREYKTILKTWAKTTVGTAVLCGVCMLGVLAFGKPVLSFVYTDDIVPYVRYLYGVLIAMGLYAMTMCALTAMVAIRKNYAVTISAFVALALCLSLTVPLVSQFGINGAILALIVSFGVQTMVLSLWLIRVTIRSGKEKKK